MIGSRFECKFHQVVRFGLVPQLVPLPTFLMYSSPKKDSADSNGS